MKKTIHIILAGALVLCAASCNSYLETDTAVTDSGAPVILTATYADPVTKATISESDGEFAFSAGDAIKVFDGTDTFSGTTADGGTAASFTMDSGFDVSGAGLAAFPSQLVTSISSATAVTFEFPSSYAYSEVGGADADAARVPVPMVAVKAAGSTVLAFKQVGSLIRFRLTRCMEGVLHFTFTTAVTGTAALTAVDPGTTEVTASSLSGTTRMTIAVTGVPEVASGSYIYITLPVPVGTDPKNVSVVNLGGGSVASATLSGTAAALERAGGYKRGVTLGEATTPEFSISATKKVSFSPGNLQATYNASDETWTWHFAANQFDYIGDNPGNTTITTELKEESEPYARLSADGTVDLFDWSTTWNYYGISTSQPEGSVGDWVFVDWGGLAIEHHAADFWHTLSSRDEYDYLLNTRSASTIGSTENARFLKTTVCSYHGLVIFPDDFTWDEATMGTAPACNNTGEYYGTGSFTPSQWAAMEAAGAVFLPVAGQRTSPAVVYVEQRGGYWSAESPNLAMGPRYLCFPFEKYGQVGYEWRYGNNRVSVRLVHDL